MQLCKQEAKRVLVRHIRKRSKRGVGIAVSGVSGGQRGQN